MLHDKEEQEVCDDDARSSSLGSHEGTTDAEEPEPILPEVQSQMRPPLPPRSRLSPTNSLSRSSAPLAGCGTSCPSDDTLNDLVRHADGHAKLSTSIVTRRSEDTQGTRLSKSLSTAYLLTASSSQNPDGTVINSDGGVTGGVGTSHPTTVATTHDLVALQVWASAHSQASQSPGLPTPVAAIILPPAGTPTSATAAAPSGAAATGAATTSGMLTPGSAGLHAPPTAAATPQIAAVSGLCSTSTGTTPLPPYTHSRNAINHSLASVEEPLQTLGAYVRAEAQPAEKTPTADVVWGQTERERVYNFLMYVPYQLERLILFGSLLLVDSFLGVFTLLPLRCALALAQLARGALASVTPRALRTRHNCPQVGAAGDCGPVSPVPERRPASFSGSGAGASASRNASFSELPSATASFLLAATPSFTGGGSHAAAATAAAAAAAAAAESTTRARPPGSRLSGSQLYDMVCLAILFLATVALRAVRPGSIYYWLKDITSEFLKMSVLSTAFDMLDKILSNFGNDVLEALSGTCTQWLAGKKRLWQLGSDALVAGVIVTLHALTLMCQALIVAVALNSSRNGLVALLIANNFVEIKSTVFKKWDSTRIWALVCADAVERFHLLVVLSFVVVEEMDSAASWSPPPDYLRVCVLMVAAEVVIDVIKHAVLGKFNEVRPGLYREFHQDLCAKALEAQSHSAPRLLNFHHLAPAALAMRILVTLFWLRVETRAQVWPRLAIGVVLYGMLCGVKLLFGYCIKVLAHYHTRYYSRKYGGKVYGARPAPAARVVPGTTTVHSGHALGAGPIVSAPLPHCANLVAPSQGPLAGPTPPALPALLPPVSPGPAAAALAATAALSPASAPALSPGPAVGDSLSQPLLELSTGSTPATGSGGLSGSRTPLSPVPLLGAAARRLSGPAPGLSGSVTGPAGPAAVVAAAAGGSGASGGGAPLGGLKVGLLASWTGQRAGSGHAKVD